MCSSDQNQKWVALAEVKPRKSCELLDQPAFVNIVGIAIGEDAFVQLVRHECDKLYLHLSKLEDLELWQNRIQNSEPNDKLIALADSLSKEEPLKFDSFYCFPDE